MRRGEERHRRREKEREKERKKGVTPVVSVTDAAATHLYPLPPVLEHVLAVDGGEELVDDEVHDRDDLLRVPDELVVQSAGGRKVVEVLAVDVDVVILGFVALVQHPEVERFFRSLLVVLVLVRKVHLIIVVVVVVVVVVVIIVGAAAARRL